MRAVFVEVRTPSPDHHACLLPAAEPLDAQALVALAEPTRIVRNLQRLSGLETGDPFTFIECLPQFYPVDGRATPASPGA